MKISNTPKSPSGVRAKGVDSANPFKAAGAVTAPTPAGVSSAGSSSPVDKIVLAGITGPELTPRVREALLTLMGEVQTLRSELKMANERLGSLERLADRDPLLDIFNRRAFVRELDRTVATVDRHDMKASLIIVDLNDLKKINDGMGHGAGDAALAHVAAVLSENVRQTDVVGRLGGDEFGVLLAHADQDNAGRKSAELAALTAATPVQWENEQFFVQISNGVVEIPKGTSVAKAMEQADSAMYAVKRGR